MRLALAQLALSEDVEENAGRAWAAMEEAAAGGAKAICFPEVQCGPFFPQYPGRNASRYVMGIDHPFLRQMAARCRELGMVAFPNVYLEEGGRRFDASPVIDADGTLRGVSKMVHVVQMPEFYEQDYYTPSDTGFRVYDTAIGKVGVVICFDRHFPESIRTCVLRGAELIVIPTANTKAEPMELFAWELRVPAMQNGVYIAMCNRVGVEGAMAFAGESIVVDPAGEVVAKADDRAQVLFAEVDRERVTACRRARPYLALRRPEAYER